MKGRAEICLQWPHGLCFPVIGSVEVGCMHTWKSDVLLAAALAVLYRVSTIQQCPLGQLSPAQVADFISLCPSNVPGFNMR